MICALRRVENSCFHVKDHPSLKICIPVCMAGIWIHFYLLPADQWEITKVFFFFFWKFVFMVMQENSQLLIEMALY